MKVLLDIKDSKADFVMELLSNLPFVKAKPLTDKKTEILEGIKQAVKEMQLIKAGKLEGRDIKEVLNEL